MPIYAYRCSNCGHEEDVLQKMSDAPLSQCPACGQSTYVKQVTAAGFQLKGSGWYVTDFRDGGKKPADKSGDKGGDKGVEKGSDKAAPATEAKPGAGAATSTATSTAATPAPSTPAPSTSASTPTSTT